MFQSSAQNPSPPGSVRSVLGTMRKSHPVAFYALSAAAVFIVVRVVDGFLRRRCSAPATGLRDPLRADNLSCRLQRLTDIAAKLPERVIAAAMPSQYYYSPESGKLVKLTQATVGVPAQNLGGTY